MKIVTWNINGIRTFKNDIKKVLDSLDADIICVQETKVTRDLLDERAAIVDGYNSYFSFSRGRSGYSGVATYCKDSATPFAAEEGLTGLLTNHEGTVGCYGDHTEFTTEELQLLDNEGRAVITRHRIKCENQIETVTVVNVYCPRADPEKPERKLFKLQFYKLLQCRAEAILGAGSHVIVLGDVNTSHRPIDHCDPSDIDVFEDQPGRRWLDGFLLDDGEGKESAKEPDEESEETSTTDPVQKSGRFVDTFRRFHPALADAFTCWSTLTGARRTNYGTRIDYIFADRRLAEERFVAAGIMPEVEGSDHCPAWGRLSCVLLPGARPPPLCTRHLPEFAGRQQKLSRFLVKVDQQQRQQPGDDALPGSQEAEERRENVSPLFGAGSAFNGKKRPLAAVESAGPKGKKSKSGAKAPAKPQGSLLAFFKPRHTPPQAPSAEAPVSHREKTPPDEVTSSQNFKKGLSTPPDAPLSAEEGDRQKEAGRPTTSEPPAAGPSSGPQKGASLGGFWKSVLRGPPPPPPCKGHGEPCVLRTVKKEGPNAGRQFFVCCRPQGHASNPEARCNFFVWVDKGK